MIFPGDIFAGQRFAVVGLGRNGLAAARALMAMGAEVTAWDDSSAAREQAIGLHVAIPEMRGLDALVLSPGIAHTLPRPHPIAAAANAAGVQIWSDAELLFRAVRATGSPARFVGITGTNGKSTTTALVAHLLKSAGVPVAAGGNLGPAALSLPRLAADGVYVLEMSSYMLERLATLRFNVAAMLNLTPDHLDRHGDMRGYAAAKREIFARQTAVDVAVIGVDDAPSREMADWLRTRPARVVACSVDDALPDLPASLRGQHNRQNASVALAIVEAMLSDAPSPRPPPEDGRGSSQRPLSRFRERVGERVLHALATFPGLPHRMEHVATIEGVAFVNDSKATNADSASRALACYGRIMWIAGGVAKAGGIETMANWSRIAHAVLIGQAAEAFAATLTARRVSHEIAGTLEAAVPAAFAAARRTGAETVLLSPACASFDQFANFEQRGDIFRDLVAALRGV